MEKERVNPELWVERYADDFYRFAFYKVSDEDLARDLVQDTFLSGIESIQSYRGEASERTWLMSILKHKIIDVYRKKKIFEHLDQVLVSSEEKFNEQFFEPTQNSDAHWRSRTEPIAWSDHPESLYEQVELGRILEKCIEKLPLHLKLVFCSKFIEEKESSLICKEFGITASNYWVIIHRAKLITRDCVEKNGIQV